jgi:hypothetical protein
MGSCFLSATTIDQPGGTFIFALSLNTSIASLRASLLNGRRNQTLVKPLRILQRRAFGEVSLSTLARQMSHTPFPEELYLESTLSEPGPNTAKPDEEEEVMTMNLALKVTDHLSFAKVKAAADYREDESDVENSHEEDEQEDQQDNVTWWCGYDKRHQGAGSYC